MFALGTCPSTNTWALDHLDRLVHGDCVWTEHQSAGRGRDGRVWRSPPGVLTASFVIDLAQRRGQVVPMTRLSLAAGLAICHAITDLVGATAAIKWPNDVLIGERKVAGVLCETRSRSDGSLATVIGIGLNLAPRWDQDGASLPLATGARAPIGLDEVGTPPTPLDTLAKLRRYLLEAAGLLAAGTWQPVLAAIRDRDALRGRRIRVETATAVHLGTAQGLSDDGALRLTTASGEVVLASGHVEPA